MSKSQHWNSVYSDGEDTKLGWYENDACKTFELLSHIPEWNDSTVFLPGAGTSVLIEELLTKGSNLILNDISVEALNRVKERVPTNYNNLHWLCQDISKPILNEIPEVDIWIDRAVLHFLNDNNEIEGYFDNVASTLKVGGYAIFAEYSKIGAYKCSGLVIHQYDVRELSDRLGAGYELVSYFKHTHITPSGGLKPYIYTLFKRLE